MKKKNRLEKYIGDFKMWKILKKALIYKIFVTTYMFLISIFITQQLTQSITITLLDFFGKLIIYCIWEKIYDTSQT